MIPLIIEGKYRGRKTPVPKFEHDFWDKFPELLFDDPEDPYNSLIGRLRDKAIKYFEDYDKGGIK